MRMDSMENRKQRPGKRDRMTTGKQAGRHHRPETRLRVGGAEATTHVTRAHEHRETREKDQVDNAQGTEAESRRNAVTS